MTAEVESPDGRRDTNLMHLQEFVEEVDDEVSTDDEGAGADGIAWQGCIHVH